MTTPLHMQDGWSLGRCLYVELFDATPTVTATESDIALRLGENVDAMR